MQLDVLRREHRSEKANGMRRVDSESAPPACVRSAGTGSLPCELFCARPDVVVVDQSAVTSSTHHSRDDRGMGWSGRRRSVGSGLPAARAWNRGAQARRRVDHACCGGGFVRGVNRVRSVARRQRTAWMTPPTHLRGRWRSSRAALLSWWLRSLRMCWADILLTPSDRPMSPRLHLSACVVSASGVLGSLRLRRTAVHARGE